MKKNNSLKIILLAFLIICTVAIVVTCAIFVNNENNKGKNNQDNPAPSSYSFRYDTNFTAFLGDDLNFSPTNSTELLIYSSSNTEILSISQSGNAIINKCGNVEVTVRKGNDLIKTFNLTITAKFNIKDVTSSTYTNNTFLLNSNIATFKIDLVNSAGNIIYADTTFEITSSPSISAYEKFGSIWIEATESGTLTLSYPSINYIINFDIAVQ